MAESRRRGFAAMDASKQRAIARKGGKAAHEKGTAHEFSPEEARAAGKKGGAAVSRDRAHMAAIGKKGGERRSRARRESQETRPSDERAREAEAPVTPPDQEHEPLEARGDEQERAAG